MVVEFTITYVISAFQSSNSA